MEIKNSELQIESIVKERIFVLRGKKVILDRDLAELYQVPTSRLNEQVKRNISRFPEDFAFKLSLDELSTLRSQIAISKPGRGGNRFLPYVFTEHGIAMLSSVLNSEKAIQMNILIIRIFIKIKELILNNKDLEIKIGNLERKQIEQGNQLNTIQSTIKHLIEEPLKPKGRIGFRSKESGE